MAREELIEIFEDTVLMCNTRLWERLLITNGIERAEFASKTPAIEAIIFRDYIKEVS